eukprot:GHVT01001123.1.p1 GENE.GHVT01001123.1~~GHVT01001123.1.p1  ORF type:complete len:431 (+),score=117.94 GHVT01001123.1:790-2082(+)
MSTATAERCSLQRVHADLEAARAELHNVTNAKRHAEGRAEALEIELDAALQRLAAATEETKEVRAEAEGLRAMNQQFSKGRDEATTAAGHAAGEIQRLQALVESRTVGERHAIRALEDLKEHQEKLQDELRKYQQTFVANEGVDRDLSKCRADLQHCRAQLEEMEVRMRNTESENRWLQEKEEKLRVELGNLTNEQLGSQLELTQLRQGVQKHMREIHGAKRTHDTTPMRTGVDTQTYAGVDTHSYAPGPPAAGAGPHAGDEWPKHHTQNNHYTYQSGAGGLPAAGTSSTGTAAALSAWRLEGSRPTTAPPIYEGQEGFASRSNYSPRREATPDNSHEPCGVALAIGQPSATAAVAVEVQHLQSLDKQLMILSVEKNQIEAELNKMPTSSKGRTVRGRLELQQREARLQEVETAIHKIRQTLRQHRLRKK